MDRWTGGWVDGWMNRGERELTYKACPLAIFYGGGTEIENHHFATIIVMTGSSKNHQWVINLGRKF